MVPQRAQRQCPRFAYQYMVSSLLIMWEQPAFVHLRLGTLGRADDSEPKPAVCLRARDKALALSILFTRSPGTIAPWFVGLQHRLVLPAGQVAPMNSSAAFAQGWRAIG